MPTGHFSQSSPIVMTIFRQGRPTVHLAVGHAEIVPLEQKVR